MQNLIKSGVAVLLKSIIFENIDSDRTKKIEFIDEFKTISIKPDLAEFEITRVVSVDLQKAYNLKVVVGVQIFAKEGVDLTKNLNEKIIEENKVNITSTVMSYMSSLVSQITGSFNGIPIITAPSLKLEQDNKK